tara:strand:+ start:754 stop:936 length:183 start_codon:yes stop_codon:yes gene_type:complete
MEKPLQIELTAAEMKLGRNDKDTISITLSVFMNCDKETMKNISDRELDIKDLMTLISNRK